MRTFAVLVVGASMTLATVASGQTQTPPPAGQKPSPGSQSPAPAPEQEKKIEGQVKSINPARTELTLTDGTRLVAPVGAVIRPGLLNEGATVIAKYTEEGGEKVMTELSVVKDPSASPPSEPRSPSGPATPAPSDGPKR
jgi:hypothetical protein